MSDYFTIPKTNRYDDAGFYEDGITLYSRGGIGNWKVAYNANENYDLRIGVYSHHNPYTGDDSYFFIVMSPIEIPYQSVDIRVVAPTLYMNFDYSAVDLDSVYGWWTTKGISGMAIENFSTELTVFTTLELLQEAMKYYDNSGGSGVVVTCIGSVIPPDPENEGVVVHCTGQLLNPYAPGGNAEPGGGGGQFDNPTDPIELPALPTHGVTDFIRLWNPSDADMVRLTELLFTSNVFTQAVRDLIGQPIDYIVSLGIVPVPLSIGSVSTPFVLAHQNAGFNMYGVAQQYMRWSCGSVKVPPYWNSFLDFEPHTSIQLYLPFIGFRDVLPSDVVGKTVTITYHIDVFTGACVAYVANEDTILYQYNGTCLSPIPFGAEQMQNVVSGIVGLIGSAATAAAVLTGGFAAGIAKSILAGSAIGAASSALSLPEHKAQHGGNAGSTVGLLSSRKPYFVLNRPRQAVASSQGIYSGFATWYTVESFGQLDGYTQVAECHLHDIPATDWELQEIERLLKEGVIF